MSPWLLNMISKTASGSGARPDLLKFHSQNGFEVNKKSCVLCGNFISIYKINRASHGRLGIRILSSRAERSLTALEGKIRIAARPCNILYIID